jgi:hypothetical protein
MHAALLRNCGRWRRGHRTYFDDSVNNMSREKGGYLPARHKVQGLTTVVATRTLLMVSGRCNGSFGRPGCHEPGGSGTSVCLQIELSRASSSAQLT